MSPHRAESGPEGDENEETGDKKDPLTRWIAVTLAAMALLGAVIAVLQTNASVNEANTARETTRTAVAALRAGVVENAGVRLEQNIDAEQGTLLREQAFVVNQAAREGSDAEPLDPDELGRQIEAAGGELPAVRTQEQLEALTFRTELLTLTQQTLAETRVAWNDRSTQYTTAIAVLAVALFLTGFSLALRRTARRIFYGLGICVALAAIGVTAYVYSLGVPETPQSAIDRSARGVVDTTYGRQEQAVERLSEAIEMDEDFDAPYTRRAAARVLGANPDFLVTGAVTGGGEVFDEAVSDLRTALDLGGDRDFLTLTLVSLVAFYGGGYDASVRAADEAIEINAQVPDIRLLRSAAEVGRGDAQAARESLEGALELLSGSDPSERTRALAADYITYLEAVIAAEPEHAELATELEQQLVAVETGFTLGQQSPGMAREQGSVAVEGLRYRDGRLRLRLVWEDLPADTQVTGIEFERPVPGGPWVQPSAGALFLDASGSGEEVVSAPLQRECQPTEVRVDVYLDGERIESATGPGVAPTC